jgi:hypothetical protein
VPAAAFTARVSHPVLRMLAVKNSNEAAAGALAIGADNRQQRFEAGADRRGRRRYFVGQQDRRLGILSAVPIF